MLVTGGKAADSIPSQVKNEWSYTFITPYAFMACIKETFASNAWEQSCFFGPIPSLFCLTHNV
jgi:hypothetical protein